MKFFGRITTLSLIREQITVQERQYLQNHQAADHYQALAEGNNRTLKRLREMEKLELKSKEAAISASFDDVEARPSPKRLRAFPVRSV